jgi:NADPH:quinone reductase-like Zn-dependent oxidoreductase
VEDFTQSGIQYDLILAINGYHPLSDYLRALKPEGTYVVAGGSMRQLIQAGTRKKQVDKNGRQKIHALSLEQNQQDLVFLKGLLESGKVIPIIDVCYPLNRIADAMRYFEQEHPRGKVVIRLV